MAALICTAPGLESSQPMAAAGKRPTLLGIFTEDGRARAAMRTLREIGYVPRHFGGAVEPGDRRASRGMLNTADPTQDELVRALIAQGVPVVDAQRARLAMARGRAIVTVQPARLPHFAERELILAGAESVMTWSWHRVPGNVRPGA